MSEAKGLSRDKVEKLRREYKGQGIAKDNVHEDPLQQFEKWFQVAVESNLIDSNAMTLATADAEGRPSSRVVLLKGYDQRGFVFYTNYKSRKAVQLDENPHASLCFYWKEFERQIRIRGQVVRLPREESESYFETRPRDSQIGAWASLQSGIVENRAELEKNFRKYEEKFKGKEVPLPEFWGGYLLEPTVYEFWQGRPSRMHDRLEYKWSKNEGWKIRRLSP